MKKSISMMAVLGLFALSAPAARADGEKKDEINRKRQIVSAGINLLHGSNSNGYSATAAGAQAKQTVVIPDSQELVEADTAIRLNAGRATHPDNKTSTALGLEMRQGADLGWKPLPSECSPYLNGGVGYGISFLGSAARGAKATAFSVGALARVGAGLACIDGKTALILTPFVGADLNLLHEDLMLTVGGRYRAMIGDSFSGIVEVLYKVGTDDPDAKTKEVVMAIQYIPAGNLALGADARVTENQFANKDPVSGEPKDKSLATVVSVTAGVAF